LKKLILLAVLVFVVFVVVERERLFLRDPLAKVTRNDVIEENTRVYINYSNDVLLEHTEAPVTLTIVQHGQHIGTPRMLRCLHWTACMTDGEQAGLIETMAGPVGEMSGKMVEFKDDMGRDVKVTLR
jgi:hypothetical protein